MLLSSASVLEPKLLLRATVQSSLGYTESPGSLLGHTLLQVVSPQSLYSLHLGASRNQSKIDSQDSQKLPDFVLPSLTPLPLPVSPCPTYSALRTSCIPTHPCSAKHSISPPGIVDQSTQRTTAGEPSVGRSQSSTQCSILYQAWVSEQTMKTVCSPSLSSLFNMKRPGLSH